MSFDIVDYCVVCGQFLPPLRATRAKRHITSFCSNACWRKHQKTPERLFWRYVDKHGPVPPHCPELGSCWVWTGKRKAEAHDYGMVHDCNRVQRQIRAHRYSWELHNGPLDRSLKILHLCDNPPCVNPAHLRPGTQRENVADMDAKGRRVAAGSPGERNPRARFTDADVLNIRQAYANGFTQTELMEIFETGQASISNIVNGRIWKHVGGPITRQKQPDVTRLVGVNNHNSKLNPDKVRYIRKAHSEGATVASLAREFGVNESPVWRIIRGAAWRHVT